MLSKVFLLSKLTHWLVWNESYTLVWPSCTLYAIHPSPLLVTPLRYMLTDQRNFVSEHNPDKDCIVQRTVIMKTVKYYTNNF